MDERRTIGWQVTPRLLACACALLLACSSDDPGTGTDNIGTGDGGGGMGGSHFPLPDADVDEDDDAGEHSIDVGDTPLCRYDDDDVLELGASSRIGLSSATDERGFALLHHDAEGALAIEALELGEDPMPSVALVAAGDAMGTALLAASGERFAMLWRDGDTLRLRALERDAEQVTVSSALAAPGPSGDELFAIAAVPSGFVVVFVDDESGERVARAQAFDLDGEALDDAVALDLDDSEPAFVQLTALEDGGLLLLWSAVDEDDAERFAIWSALLDDALEIDGDVNEVSKDPASSARFQIDARSGSVGLLYATLEGDTRDSLKLQRIEPSGVAEQAVVNIANAPRRVIDGSIAAFGQGYAVAYRMLTSLGVPDPIIRVAFIDAFGLIVYEAEIVETSEDAGATSLAATARGQLLVSFQANAAGTLETQALSLDCPGALRLCGGDLE